MNVDVLHTHAAFAALIALCQWVGFTPLLWPWLATTAVGRQLGFLPTLGLGVCIGLLANFQVFFIAVAAGQGAWPAWVLPAGAAALTVLAWAWLARCFRHVQRAEPAFPVKHSWHRDAIGMAAVAVALVLFVQDAAHSHPGVFEAWDTICSWNRWAVEWHRQILPIYTAGYPQLLPTALAGLYGWIDPQAAEPVARLFLLLFPALPCLLFVDGYRRWRDDAFLWGCAAWLVLLRFAFRGMADSGYADVPVACFVAVTAYLLLLGCRGVDRGVVLTLAAISAAAALLTKQPGGIAWLLWLGTAAALVQRRQLSWSSAFAKALIFLLIAAPWYLWTAWRIWTGVDITNIDYLVGSIHADRNWGQRIGRALQGPLMDALAGFGSATMAACVIVALLVMACKRSDGRRLIFGVCLPYLLLWASLFSYDIRNLLPAVVPVAWALGIGVRSALDTFGRKRLPAAAAVSDSTMVVSIQPWLCRWVPVGVLALVAMLTWAAPWSIEDLRLRQSALQREAVDPALNRYLLDYARSPGFGGMVMGTYAPMLFIEELKLHTLPLTDNSNALPRALHQAVAQGRPWCELIAIAPQFAQVRYLVLHNFLLLPTIESSRVEGSLRIVHEQGGLRLQHVGCPHP
ncbi:MAG: hypothetical protein V4679_13940 [Pseudomonadota bacterium]